jgi:hypothetical protein
MHLYAIGVGGSGAKCIEALTHLHAAGLLHDEQGNTIRLGTFLVEPDQQSTLLTRAETAIERYIKLQGYLDKKTQSFARGQLRHYGVWSPLSSRSGANRLDQIFAKPMIRTTTPALEALFDCLFPPEEQQADLGVGFRGRPPIGAAVMSRINLKQEAQAGQWQQMLNDIKTAPGGGEKILIHLFGSVFGGTGASGVPTLGQMLKNWLVEEKLKSVRVNASLLLPYFDFEGQGQEDTGVHAEARNFQLNTDAALQYLASDGHNCFDRVYLIGSDIKARYDFSIGGRSQQNAAHLVELLAALGSRHSLLFSKDPGYSYVLSRKSPNKIVWQDIPDSGAVGLGLATAARFSVAWHNNLSLELNRAQEIPPQKFYGGAPWASQFFELSSGSSTQGGRPSIRDTEQLTIKAAVDTYCEVLMQWLEQISANVGSGFTQELFTPDLLRPTKTHERSLAMIVRGSARPNRSDEDDTVERIKFSIDDMNKNQISSYGVPGLVDTLWRFCS